MDFLNREQKTKDYVQPYEVTSFQTNCIIENLITKINKVFQQQKIRKKYRKLYSFSLELLPDHLKIESLKNQAFQVEKKDNIYSRIQQKIKQKEIFKSELVVLFNDQEKNNHISQKQFFSYLEKYRLLTLEYAQSIIQMCQLLSQGQEEVYERLLSHSGRFFIKLQKTSIVNLLPSILLDLLQLNEGFDPLLLKLKVKKDKNRSIGEILILDSELKKRFAKANQQMLEATKDNFSKQQQFKINISGINSVLKKYSLGDTQRLRSQSNNELSPRKLSLGIQNRYEKGKQQKNDDLQKRIFQNFRKKRFQQKLAKSLDSKCSQVSTKQRTFKSTEKIVAKLGQKQKLNIKNPRLSKILNFKGIQLQPLKKRAQNLNLSLDSSQMIAESQGENNVKKNHQLNIRIKNYRNVGQFSNRMVVSKNQSLTNASQSNKNSNEKSFRQTFTPKNLSSLATKKYVYHKFKPYNDRSSQFLDQSFQNNILSAKNSQILETNATETIKQMHLEEVKNLNQQNTSQKENIQMIPEGILDVQQNRPEQVPQPSSNFQEESESKSTDLKVEKQNQKIQEEQIKSIYQKHEKDKKKILLKAPKLQTEQIQAYLNNLGVHQNKSLLKDIFQSQHYINQFYLNDKIFCIIVFAPSLNLKQLSIKLIHQINGEKLCLGFDQDMKQRLRKIMIQNYVDVLSKSSKNLKAIRFQSQKQNFVYLTQCGFVLEGSNYLYKFTDNKQTKKSSKQFLSMGLSIISVSQNVNESFLYSDDICPFKSGKYDANEKIFSDFNLEPLQSEFCGSLQNINQVNQVLESKEFDTFQQNTQFSALLEKSDQNEKKKIQLKVFSFHQVLNKNFIISNGWIKTTSSLIFNDKNQNISQFILSDNFQLYFGKGFEHIGTMKNKILHHKSRLNSSKSQQKLKDIATQIKMFSKQLYGLIKHQDGVAFYGNWEMNFHFKHEFIGKIGCSIETQNREDQLVFGNEKFFVAVYCKDQFTIGWEVEDSDFLY